jgi:hypothetical protein
MFDSTSGTWQVVVADLQKQEDFVLNALRTEEDHSKVRFLQGQLKAVSLLRALPDRLMAIDNNRK